MPYAAAGATEASPIAPHLDKLAQAAIAPIENGMIVGLGTGRTSSRAIRALAQRVRTEHLDVACVATSLASEALARELGLKTIPFSEVLELDYLFDGADEVDPHLRMMKGSHGAITRQRLVAMVASRCVYMTQEEKVVEQLGTNALLAVTIIPFGIASIREYLRHMGLSGILRRNMDNEVLVTDGGGVVLDMRIEGKEPEALAAALDRVPGVVDHGFFLEEADEVLVEGRTGEVRRMTAAE